MRPRYRNTLLTACVILGLMMAFPPWVRQIHYSDSGGTVSLPIGHHFLFAPPVEQYRFVSIAAPTLCAQVGLLLAVTGGIVLALMAFEADARGARAMKSVLIAIMVGSASYWGVRLIVRTIYPTPEPDAQTNAETKQTNKPKSPYHDAEGNLDADAYLANMQTKPNAGRSNAATPTATASRADELLAEFDARRAAKQIARETATRQSKYWTAGGYFDEEAFNRDYEAALASGQQ